MAGLTPTGFVAKTVDELLEDLADAQRASPALGPDIDTTEEEILGQLNGVMATKLRELWELGQAVYNARGRSASYAALDQLCALTGVYRLPATRGTVTLSVGLGAGVTLPTGSVAHVAGQPENRWRTIAPAVNSSGSPAVVTALAEAETAGYFVANALSITAIATPVAGWTGVSNLTGARPGRNRESNAALRIRRDSSIRAGGSSPLDAIRAALLAVDGVTQVSVYENATDGYAGTQPPHSVEALVTGGTNLAVATALWGAKAGGIYTHGTTGPVFIVDASGTTRAVRFSRPADVDVYIRVALERDAGRYGGSDAVKAAIAALGDSYVGGSNVRQAVITGAALSVAGVADVTEVLIGTSAPGRVDANLNLGLRQIPRLDTSRIELVETDVTP